MLNKLKLLNMRKQILLGVLTAFGLTASMQVNAQSSNFKCGVQQQLKKLYADNPQLEQDYRELVSQYKETKTVDGKTRQVYIIPVVFHILHEYGSENVTDAQIYDQMEILNEDFRKQNADTVNIIPQFDTIAADAMIEFRLATIDPYGNCTNGIEHIYTHLSNNADDFVKVNQWMRGRYLNIWVVNSIGEAGVAGYAYYPTATTGGFFFADGIIILNDYVGSIGTGSPFSSRALTHEIGHYLGLSHTWGSTNDPEVACGDDDVEDTPMTAGHDNCANLFDDECNEGIVENVQNFMEYSYCSNMYTEDQATFMHNVLAQETAQRNNLYTDSNLVMTGALVFPAPTCVPEADFSADKFMACVGDPITFKDASWRAGVTDYAWSFPGGSPATSTVANPSVTYSTPGYYSVTLTATNAAGSDTKTMTNMIYISGMWPEFVGPTADNFDGPSAGWWITRNPENNHARFTLMPNTGTGGSKAFMLNNYRNVAGADAYTSDWFYYNRLGGSKDYLISPAYDLASTSGITISFDYAYGTKATTLDDITEEVRVYSSRDCGKTWQLRSDATLSGSDIITAGYVGDDDFVPTNPAQWKTNTFNYTPTAQDTKTRFRIEFTASDLSSNFFVDNWNISGVLGIEENGQTLGVSLSPNPVSAGSDIAVEIEGTSEDMQLHLVDINGALISTTMVAASNGTQTVMVPMNVAKGCYFIQAVKGNIKSTHRVIVF
jgi:PKD repeat protein